MCTHTPTLSTPDPSARLAGRPVHAQPPAHTPRWTGGTVCASECPRSCTRGHAVHRCPRGLPAGVTCWQVHAQDHTPLDPGAPRAQPASQLLTPAWPHLRRGSTGLYRGSSRCSNHSHEQGHQELGTGDKHRPSRPAAFMAGVPVMGTRKLCSWPAGGPQRAETGGLSPGPEKVWGNLPSQKAVLPSQHEACGDMQCTPCSH